MKRVVFQHANGLYQICGLGDRFPDVLEGPFDIMGHTVQSAPRVRETKRYVLFREAPCSDVSSAVSSAIEA